MQQREIAPIACGVQRRRGFGDVLSDDSGVADLFVAVAELVVGESDRLGVVCLLGVSQRAAEQRDRARLVSLGKGNPSVQTPQRGQECRRQVSRGASGGRPSVADACDHVVTEQPRFGERTLQADLVLVFESRGLQRLREHRDGVGMAPALQCRSCARQRRLKGDGDHGREYTTVR